MAVLVMKIESCARVAIPTRRGYDVHVNRAQL
eukprot:COSAG01_NODE_3274_length_6319_cov_22.538585_4_plen_32_part_00